MTEKLNDLNNKLKKHRYYDWLLDAFFCLIGSIIYAVSVAVFTAPNQIAPGGVTGIATILYYLFHTPIGVVSFVLNIPLLILGLRFIGGPFIVKTVICTALTSAFIDILAFLPKYHHNVLLAALYGGVISGIGLAFIFLRGATTGGTDVASRLMKLKFRHVPMGQMMMIIDTFIVILSSFVFKSIDSGLYAMLTIFTCSKVIDSILYGSDNGKMLIIISDKNDEIASAVINDMDRGITILKGKGYYTGKDREVLMCAVRRPETTLLRSIIIKVDPNAFIIVCEAGEIIGEGFKPITKEV